MIRIKTKKEIEILRDGGKKLALILDNLVKLSKPGVSTAFLEKEALRMMKEIGGRPAFKDLEMYPDKFPTALCTSINDEIVHAPAYPARELMEGDIIGIDIGMEYPLQNSKTKGIPYNKYSKLGGYYTDMAVTVAVGEISKEARDLLDTTKKSLELGISQVKPGAKISDIGRAIQPYAESRGYSVVRDLIGHGVGHDVHEDPQVPNYEVLDNSVKDIKLKV